MRTVDLRGIFVSMFVVVSVAVSARAASAQAVYETLHEFVQGQSYPAGRLLEASDGRLYGVASEGGAFGGGTIFVMGRQPDNSWSVSTLHAFAPSEGTYPLAGLAQGVDGLLYGTTSAQGPRGGGTVFRITLSGTFQVLHAFNPAVDGVAPLFGPLVRGLDGAFYGLTSAGGPGGNGTIFKVTTAGVFTRLRSFAGVDGARPLGSLVLGPDGFLYGVTSQGGLYGGGTAFKISSQGSFTRLFSFPAGPFSSKSTPAYSLVVGPDGNLYGTTTGVGGAPSPMILDCTFATNGEVFRLTPNGALTWILPFSEFGCPRAPYLPPTGGLTLGADGWLYGVRSVAAVATHSTNSSRIFRFDPANPGTLAYLFEPVLDQRPTAHPLGGLIQASDGAFYGASYRYGDQSHMAHGFVFGFDPANTFDVLHLFTTDAFKPTGSLARANDGTLYGLTSYGGRDYGCHAGCGTVFNLSNAGVTTEPFTVWEGARAFGDLTAADDGTLFGVADRGSSGSHVFQWTAAGIAIELDTTTGLAQPPIVADDGALWYTDPGANESTTSSPGHIKRRTFDPPVATFGHAFSGSDGSFPFGGLVQADDGHLYGTTATGGNFGYGTIFRVNLAGVVTTLHHFSFGDGAAPLARLVQASDGRLYGTTTNGGTAASGTVFRIATDGSGYQVVHSFVPSEGAHPFARLYQGSNGILYGTTVAGAAGGGSVFSVTTAGAFSVVHIFGPGQGAAPLGGITEGADGALYGTTFRGGVANQGVLYRLTLPLLTGTRD